MSTTVRKMDKQDIKIIQKAIALQVTRAINAIPDFIEDECQDSLEAALVDVGINLGLGRHIPALEAVNEARDIAGVKYLNNLATEVCEQNNKSGGYNENTYLRQEELANITNSHIKYFGDFIEPISRQISKLVMDISLSTTLGDEAPSVTR